MSGAGTAAVSWVALTKEVGRALPFQLTTESNTKPEPLTVSVKAAPPAAAEVGDMDCKTGRGFCALMVKVCADDVPPPGAGLVTVICAVPN
jgi:hypothetical protein